MLDTNAPGSFNFYPLIERIPWAVHFLGDGRFELPLARRHAGSMRYLRIFIDILMLVLLGIALSAVGLYLLEKASDL